MRFIKHIRLQNSFLLCLAVVIAISSLYVSHLLVRNLSAEERSRVEVWAEAMRKLQGADETTDLALVLKVLNANSTIPVIVANQDGIIESHRNLDYSSFDSLASLYEKKTDFERQGNMLRLNLDGENEYLTVYYGNSKLLYELAIYPYLQLLVVTVFVLIAIYALISAKRAEQNKVWVGLSKETAHQLGTPISSLMAWVELLRTQYSSDELLPAMSEDVERLQMIANRFSKIGSMPDLKSTDVLLLLERVVAYMRRRVPEQITIQLLHNCNECLLKVNPTLFEWVVENLCKNAVDAMGGVGVLTITVSTDKKHCFVDVQDTGKGIDKRHFYSVFSPGFTTKKRGWGLGLSLARRIIEEYHYGRIFVKESGINKGTTFRIELKK
ncbi:MAG: HAMP domain-containing histidine kinase [Bacteroides sp.]|nr:HAMP domain-containing histidine kinase [Bacteroides sp.]